MYRITKPAKLAVNEDLTFRNNIRIIKESQQKVLQEKECANFWVMVSVKKRSDFFFNIIDFQWIDFTLELDFGSQKLFLPVQNY
jgi:hypothetical protein